MGELFVDPFEYFSSGLPQHWGSIIHIQELASYDSNHILCTYIICHNIYSNVYVLPVQVKSFALNNHLSTAVTLNC